MRPLIAAAVLLAVCGPPEHAAAAEYPWCVYYMDGDVSNCGFVSLQQCRMAVTGMGGYCQPNLFYVSPGAAKPRTRARPRSS